MISDSCFSGGALRWVDDEEPLIDHAHDGKALKKASRQAISSGGLEAVQDRGFGGHSVFTHFLIRFLSETESRFVSPIDIFDGLKDGVAGNSEQLPEIGRLNNSGDAKGLFFLLNKESEVGFPIAECETRNMDVAKDKQAHRSKKFDLANADELYKTLKKAAVRFSSTSGVQDEYLSEELRLLEKENEAARKERTYDLLRFLTCPINKYQAIDKYTMISGIFSMPIGFGLMLTSLIWPTLFYYLSYPPKFGH